MTTISITSTLTTPPSPTTTTTTSTTTAPSTITTTTQCFICTNPIKRKSTNVLQKTKHSSTPIFIFLDRIINEPLLVYSSDTGNNEQQNLNPPEYTEKIDKTGICCRSCVIKINNYDRALLTAEQIQKEIQQIYNRKFETPIKNEYQNDNESDYANEKTDSTESSSIIVVQNTKFTNIRTEHIVADVIDSGDSDNDNDVSDNLQEYEKCEQKSPLEELLCSPSLIEANKSSKTIKKNSLLIFLQCNKCHQKFENQLELNNHIKIQHRKKSLNNEKINKNNLVCHICGQIYKSKASLLVHSRLHTTMSNIHQCKFCGKKFAQKAALARHIPIHTGESLYQCDKCGKQYIHYSSFHMHQQAHDGIREKKCSICGLLLRSSSHLSRHMRVHSGEKPYACPTCGQRFAQRYNMTVHYKAHQGIHRLQSRSYVCLICQIRFQTQSKLTEHLSVKHNSVANASNSLNGEQNCERISADLINSSS